MRLPAWDKCLLLLEERLGKKPVSTWLRPLKIEQQGNVLYLVAPNPYILEQLRKRFHQDVEPLFERPPGVSSIVLRLDNSQTASAAEKKEQKASPYSDHRLNPEYNFAAFVVGKSNQMAVAMAEQVAENSGTHYSPLLIYGGVGLGKTHLMHAIGNRVKEHTPKSKIAYLNSEGFVEKMITALRHRQIEHFKAYYRSLNCLLIDDIQFLAGKERSQEEFFYTFNNLIESGAQVVITCDRYPREVEGIEERLKSRFGSGLSVSIDPPELETRVAILFNKAEKAHITLPENLAFFIARHVQSNVRELEGALRQILAHSQITGQKLSLVLAREALRDLLSAKERIHSLDNIQKIVASYYQIRLSDLLSKSRLRAFSKPRQIAMALSKELTRFSLPEIGDAFGGRDHTTVLYACRRIEAMRKQDSQVEEDYNNLYRTLHR